MKTNNLKKLSIEQKENNYGGWAWLATAIPLFLQTVMTAVSAYKMLSSDKGSVKYDGADAHWEQKSETARSSHSSTSKKQSIFYAF